MKNYKHSKRERCTKQKLTPSAATDSNLMGRERMREAGMEGLGEDGCCWVGEGARLTCMNSRIREGKVQRAKTRWVPFPGVTSLSLCYIPLLI